MQIAGRRAAEFDYDTMLCCPECKDIYTHQFSAVVGFRKKEDEEESLIASSDVTGCALSQGPIPGRRDAIHIGFTCEGCSRVSTLNIVQHKGNTHVFWDDALPPVEKKAKK